MMAQTSSACVSHPMTLIQIVESLARQPVTEEERYIDSKDLRLALKGVQTASGDTTLSTAVAEGVCMIQIYQVRFAPDGESALDKVGPALSLAKATLALEEYADALTG